MLLNPVGNRVGVLQAVRVMGMAFLNDHGDRAAQLMIDVLHGQRMPLQQEIFSAADVQ